MYSILGERVFRFRSIYYKRERGGVRVFVSYTQFVKNADVQKLQEILKNKISRISTYIIVHKNV